jgi:hypothetical protein
VRIDSRFLNWGVFFILLGAIPLAVQANVLDRDLVSRAWQLWPLLIVGGGVGLLLRRTRFEFVGGLIAAATVGVIGGGLLAGSGLGGIGFGCGNDTGKPFATTQGTLQNGSVDLTFNCGTLALTTAAGSGWTLSGSSDDGDQPKVEASGNRLAISGRNRSFFGFGARDQWSLQLPQDPLLDVGLTLNAGSGTLAFGGAHVGTLRIQGNAGSVTVDLNETASVGRVEVHVNAGSAKVALPNASVTGSFQGNAGTIAFCIPEGVGISIDANDNIVSSNNFAEQGLTRSGNTWQSANYGTATNRATLTASANAGTITLNPRDGCR